MKNILGDKKFLKTLWILALPIAIQNFIMSSLNLVDNVMIGSLGESSIAAVGLANQYFFIFILCLSGVNAGASVFMAQYWGKKEKQKIKSVLGLDLTIGLVTSLIFAIGAIVFPEAIMKILSTDREVIAFGVSYLRVAAISYLVTNVTMAYSSLLRSTEQPAIPMYASLIGVLVNGFLNWIFIFGNLGFKPMGVVGAAIATTIARFIEMFFILAMVYVRKNKMAATIKELFDFDKNFIKLYFRTSWSVIVNEIVWSLGMTAYSIAYARIGTNAVASMQIATTIGNMFMVVFIGIAVAASIMIGTQIGAGNEELAEDYAKKIGLFSPIIGILFGAFLWILAPALVLPFNIEVETAKSTIAVLRIMAIFSPIRIYNLVMIVGIFRGGGDTTYSMLVQAGTIWLYSVPISFIAVMIFKVPVTAVYFFISLEEFIKIFFEIKRLKSGKWIKNVVETKELVRA